ncbi:MAG: formate dehydrogenase accessory sulfurtransferase FdhD [Myxococcota bacterium]
MADHRATGTVVRATQRNAAPWADDELVIEEPLEIRVEGEPLVVTMRTPGHDRVLAAGFLYSEGVIDGPDDLSALDHLGGDGGQNVMAVRLASGVAAHREALRRAQREVVATSACGLCGKTRLDQVEVTATTPILPTDVDEAILAGLPGRLHSLQPVFRRTGGLHGATLMTPTGELAPPFEDIGRHNAVDKVLGARLLADQVPVDDRFLVVSGRAGFEIVQKARVAGVPAVIAFGAASSLAVELAERSSMRLYGFVRDDRWTRYA